MPRKPKPEKPRAEILAIPAAILDQLVREGPLTAAEVDTATRRFKKALIERALGAELSHHLGYAPGTPKPEVATNHRNGTSGKTVLTDDGPVDIAVPRDRDSTFEPQLIGKHERRFTGFDDKVLALYARGLTVREIQAFLKEMYAVEVSPDLISTVTDAIVAEITVCVQHFGPIAPIEAFDVRILIRLARLDVVRGDAMFGAPIDEGPRRKFRPVVDADGRWSTVQRDEFVEDPDDPPAWQRQPHRISRPSRFPSSMIVSGRTRRPS